MEFLKQKQKKLLNENFEKWFSDSKVTNSHGQPLVVYHGTTHIFNEFKYSNEHNFLGSAYYFSDSYSDADLNYTSEGSDLKSNIERFSDNLSREYEQDPDEFISEWEEELDGIPEHILYELNFYSQLLNETELQKNKDYIIEKLKEKIDENDLTHIDAIIKVQGIFKNIALGKVKGEHEGAIMPCFLSFKKPFYYSKDNIEGTSFEHEMKLEGEIEQLKEEIKEYVNDNLSDTDFDVDDFFNEIAQELECLVETENAIYQSKFIELLENSNEIEYISEEEAESFIEWANEDLDSYYEATIEFTGSYNQFKDAAEDTAYEYGIADEISDFFANFEGNHCIDEFNAYHLIEKLRSSEIWDHAVNESKETSGYDLTGEFIKDTLIAAEYDSIIMDVESANFGFKNMDPNTKHYLAFYPNQIKSAIGNCGDYSLDNLDIAAKIQAKDSIFNENLSHEKVKNTVIEISKSWKNKPKIMFLKSQKDIPLLHKKEQPLLNKISSKTKSLLSMNKSNSKNDMLYVFTDNFKNVVDIEEVMAHEILGHYALRKREGKDYKEHLKKIFDEHKNDPIMKQLKSDYSEQLAHSDSSTTELILADEFLAYKAEKFESPGFGLKCKIAASEFLKSFGLKNTLSSKDLLVSTLYKNSIYIDNTTILKDISNDLLNLVTKDIKKKSKNKFGFS